MKMILLSLIVLSFYSCAVIDYAPKSSKNSKGYWSKKVQTGIYKVYSNYDRSSSPKRAMGYILIRGFELCAKEKKKYFSIGIVTEHSEFDNRTVSANIYCRKNQSRFGIGANFIANTTKVEKVFNHKGQKLSNGDEVLSINKKRVVTRNDIDNFLYNLKSSKRNLQVLVQRKSKKVLLKFKPIIRKDILSHKDVINVANKWNVPLKSIKGL